MKARALVLNLLVGCLLGAPATRGDTLLESNTSWDGGAIGYPEGDARITSMILRLVPGEETPFHCHPVPTMGYVLSGSVQVTTEHGKTQRFNAGSALVEVMKTAHRGRAVDGPVELLVFYAGADGVPVTVIPGSKQAETWPCGDGGF